MLFHYLIAQVSLGLKLTPNTGRNVQVDSKTKKATYLKRRAAAATETPPESGKHWSGWMRQQLKLSHALDHLCVGCSVKERYELVHFNTKSRRERARGRGRGKRRCRSLITRGRGVADTQLLNRSGCDVLCSGHALGGLDWLTENALMPAAQTAFIIIIIIIIIIINNSQR